MTADDAYNKSGNIHYPHFLRFRIVFWALSISLTLYPLCSSAQQESDFEEISVLLFIRHIGSIEIPAYIKGGDLYLPVIDLFSFLKIQNIPTPSYDTVSGIFINQQTPFLIDRVNNKIQLQKSVHELKNGDLIKTENNLYLKSNYFGEIFGLDCSFSFSSMSVTLTTKLELPAIKDLRQSMMRSNLSKLKGEIKPDTTIRRDYPIFHFGAADWVISASEIVNGRKDMHLNLALGGILAGGEATVDLNYNSSQSVNWKQQSYLWHFANNDLKAFKQIYMGKLPVQTIASISAPVIGGQISNTPTTFQRSFCSYTLSDYTEPGWIVELYVNYVLIDYAKADASGYFSFEVPLVYGNSFVKLRFYGPWGEERTREQVIRIPFNFLAPKKFEYTLDAGIVQNPRNSRYSKLNLNYGVSRRLTLGTGVEYLSTLSERPFMPFANFSLRIASSFLVSGEYNVGIRFKGIVSYRLPADLLIEASYTRLNESQTAIIAGYREERKAVITLPVRLHNFSSLVRLAASQVVLANSSYYSSEFLISGSVLGVSTNLTTSALFFNPTHPNIYSTLSFGIRLPAKVILTPQVQFSFSQGKFLSFKIEVEKRFFRDGTINLYYEKNFVNNISTLQAGVRFDFSAVQTNISARQSNDISSFQQYARGSFVYEGKGGKMKFSRNSMVGKGGIILMAFLDANDNRKFDKNEQKVAGLDIRISGGKVDRKFNDSTIIISELEPFTNYYLELNRNGFENISWQIPKPVISITVNANEYRFVQVPIKIAGEVSGLVYLVEDSLRIAQGRVLVSFYSSDSVLIDKAMTEEDGFFNFLGLSPGVYFAKLDQVQLSKLGMVPVSPSMVPFEIKPSFEGDQVGGLELLMQRLPAPMYPGNNKK